jgi:membrane protein
VNRSPPYLRAVEHPPREAPPWRYARQPHQIGLAGWWKVLKHTYGNLGADNLSIFCAGVAFYTLLSLFPALLGVVLVYGIFTDPAILRDHLLLVEPFMPGTAFAVLQDRLETLVSSSSEGLGIGLLITLGATLWSASRGASALISMLNTIYKEPESRGFIASAVLSLALTIGGITAFGLSVIVLAAVPAALALIPMPDAIAGLVSFVRWPMMALLIFLAIAVLYKIAPCRRDPNWHWVMPGAATATLLWLLGSVLFSLYIENFADYEATFGAVASIIVLMVWIYYSVFIIALGAEINAELELLTRIDTTIGPNLPMGQRHAFVADHLRR